MLTFRCPSCGKPYQAPDGLSGKMATCRNCHEKMNLPSVTSGSALESVEKIDLPASPPPIILHAPLAIPVAGAVQPTTKPCPFCESEISVSARKCRFCGETVDVILRAAEEARHLAEQASQTNHPPNIVISNKQGGVHVGASAASSSKSRSKSSARSSVNDTMQSCVGCLMLMALGVGLMIWWGTRKPDQPSATQTQPVPPVANEVAPAAEKRRPLGDDEHNQLKKQLGQTQTDKQVHPIPPANTKQSPKANTANEDEDRAHVKLTIAKSLHADALKTDGLEGDRLEREYIDALYEIVKKYPDTKAGQEAKRILMAR